MVWRLEVLKTVMLFHAPVLGRLVVGIIGGWSGFTQESWYERMTLPDSHVGGLEEDLTQLSVEELMDVEVTSVSKNPQKLSQSAAAITTVFHVALNRYEK